MHISIHSIIHAIMHIMRMIIVIYTLYFHSVVIHDYDMDACQKRIPDLSTGLLLRRCAHTCLFWASFGWGRGHANYHSSL